MAIIQVISSVENERTFSTLTVVKSKLWNQLFGHLDIVIRMFIQDFFIKDNFSFQVAIVD
jgi:hypothetical protein